MSDDYFDDDPTVLKRERMARRVEEVERNRQDQESGTEKDKGKGKGKANGTENGNWTGLDLSSFQSVIWKPPHPQTQNEPPKLYPPGEGEKVALLKNWREVFKDAKPDIDSRRRRGHPSSSGATAKGKGKGKQKGKAKSGVVDERREDSSDRTSTTGLFSRENGVGSSNTSPTKSVSADGDSVEDDLDETMIDDPGKQKGKKMDRPKSNIAVEVPLPRQENIPPKDASSPRETTLSKKRGRKRKAESPPSQDISIPKETSLPSPKRRGRKPKAEIPPSPPKEISPPKRRGRTPKTETPGSRPQPQEISPPIPKETPLPGPKRRARKRKAESPPPHPPPRAEDGSGDTRKGPPRSKRVASDSNGVLGSRTQPRSTRSTVSMRRSTRQTK